MPARLVDQQHGVAPRRDFARQLGQEQRHHLEVAPGQDQPGRLALLGADGAKDVGGRRALIVRGGWARATLGPAARDLVLLADPRLVAEPQLYIRGIDTEPARERLQVGAKVFLNASTAPSACAWWRGRAVSLR